MNVYEGFYMNKVMSDLTEDPDISRFYDMKNKKIIGKTNNETKSIPFLLLSLLNQSLRQTHK